MSVWRRRVLESFPEWAREQDWSRESLYTIFSELISHAVQAHQTQDHDALKRIYGFAAWCARQKSKDVWNPAGVSFYEHLADHEVTRAAISRWVPPDVFADVRGLLEARLTAEQFAEVLRGYKRR